MTLRRSKKYWARKVGGGGGEPAVAIYTATHGYRGIDYNPNSALWTRCADNGSLDRIQHASDPAGTWTNSTYTTEEAWMTAKNAGGVRSLMVGRGTNDQRRSDDQTAWVSMALASNNWGHLAYNISTGRWISVGRRTALQVAYSDDNGLTWAYYEVGTGAADGEYLHDVVYIGGLFIWSRGSSGIWSSPTGATWTQRYSGGAVVQGLYSDNTTCWGTCVDGEILTSSDGITWSLIGTVATYTTTAGIGNRISSGGGYVINVRDSANVDENVYYSEDGGITWSAFTASIPTLPWYRIHFADGIFVVVAQQTISGNNQMIITP
jgi:hypothetical protein